MKRTILAIIFFCVVLIGCFFLFSRNEEVNHTIESPTLKIEKRVDNKKVAPIVDIINARNTQIITFSSNLKAIAQRPRKRAARLNGDIYYEKEKKFRLKLDSILGPELDLGSDGHKFWFWSKRLDKPALYWSTYENFYKTKLKRPFNPVWLSHCLGIDIIDYKDAIIDESGVYLRVIRKSTSAEGKPITTVTYIDKNNGIIKSNAVYDQNGQLEASSEIQETDGVLPTKISFVWHKEGASMVWYLTNAYYNTAIDNKMWFMPNILPKIDMSRDF